MKDKLRRAGWLILVLLFAGTGLGIGLVGFWQYTHQENQTNTSKSMQCSLDQSIPELTAAGGTLKGTKLPHFTPTAKVDILKCIDIKVGSGNPVTATSTLTANYTGALESTGVIFESSLDSGQPFSIPLSQLIPGWQEGLLGMKPGGSRRLLIPSAAAYGPQAQPGIPANSNLVFNISLIAVQ